MNSNQNRLMLAVLVGGVVVFSFILWQITRFAVEPLPPTASVDTALTEIGAATQSATAPSITAEPTGTPPPTLPTEPTLAATDATPTLAPTETPVLAIASPPPPPPRTPTQLGTYIVQPGDTLFGISLRTGVSVEEIKGANGLTSNIIFPGQVLTILGVSGTFATSTPRPTTAATATKSASGTFGAAAIPGPSPTWSVYSFPARVPASGPSKLGFHVTLNSGGVLDYVAAVHPAVMKGVDDIGFLKDVKTLSPNTITIGRYVVDQPDIGGGDPAQRAVDFVNAWLPKYQAAPYVDYWEGWNEVTYPNYEWYAAFEAARACEMQKYGLKAAIGGFSTGTPEPWQFEAFIPAIETGIRCGAILTTHEYGAPTMYLWWSQGLPESYGHPPVPAYPDRGPLMGRYRFLYYNMLLPRGLYIPLVISETGIDGGAGAGQRPGYSNAQGWMGFWDYWGAELGRNDSINFYVEQLAWYDSLLRQDSFVIGATIFNIAGGSNPTWASFEASSIIPSLTAYAQSLR